MTLEFVIGNSDKTANIRKSSLYFVIATAICLIAAFAVSALCSSFLYKSLTKVLSKMETNNEISVEALRDGNTDGDDMENKLAETLNRLHMTQLTALQMQINPHFIFNVLNCIDALLLGNETPNEFISEMIGTLSDIMAYAMDGSEYLSTVSDELEVCEKYLSLEEIRTYNQFEVVWDIDENALDRKCIKLFLQPIIENALMHGVKKLADRKGEIIITVKCDGDDTIFNIHDNGDRIPQKKLDELKQRLAECSLERKRHIGMGNVNERIKLIYGEKYGMTINSDESGTNVTIKIGKSEEEK